MSLIKNNALVGASGAKGYMLQRSLRFRSSASAYLSRTPASAGDQDKWTWSGWVKRADINTESFLFSAGTSTTELFYIQMRSDSNSNIINIAWRDGSTTTRALATNAQYRDPSSWYHIVLTLDVAQASDADKMRLYVNGELVTSFSADSRSTLSASSSLPVNSADLHTLGRYALSASGYLDGYLTEINFIDGQALNPTYFGETDATTGVWKPISYSGTYGTNGFYLNFSDNTSTTTLGYDYSGNSNNWTANNISLTSGVTYDSMTDVPTLTSTNAANYAVMNPLAKDGGTTLSDANLKISSVDYGNNTATMFLTNGKWYWEAQGDGYVGAVCGQEGQNWSTSVSATGSKSIGYYVNGTVYWDGGNNGGGLSTYGTSDVIGVAVDMDAGTVAFYKNGSLEYTATFGSGTVPDLSAGVFPCYNNGISSTPAKVVTFNFGQRPFAYTPPAGFKSLNTYNLPDSTIEDGGEYFNTVLYSGNSSTQNITGVGFAPDFTWLKVRNDAQSHRVFDTVRGAPLRLVPNGTNAEFNATTELTAFGSDGFTLGNNTDINGTGYTYVAWNWKANGAGVSNTDGSITSTVSANTTAGFSIVSYTGNGSSSATVGHGLGVTPSMVIVKNRTTAKSWPVRHSVLTSTTNLYLDATAAATTVSTTAYGGVGVLTSSTFGFISGATNNSNVNSSANNYVAYCFTSIEGFSKFGSYTGNGSADGPFVYTGFRPAFVMAKRTNSTENWLITDNARNTSNVVTNRLYPNLSAAEDSSTPVDFLSNGFKIRAGAATPNISGGTYIFMAFAENPFKNSLAR